MIFRPSGLNNIRCTLLAAFLYSAFVLLTYSAGFAQVRIAIDNSAVIEPSAMLEVVSPIASPRGFLPPRVSLNSTSAWGLSGSAVEGMIVYNTRAALSNGVGLYIWMNGKWSKLINDAVISGAVTSGPSYGFSMLSANQTIPNSTAGTGTIINISGNPAAANSPSNIISANKVFLKANRTYRLRANGYLLGTSGNTAYAYLSWRKTGGTNTEYVGNRVLLLAANWGGSYSSGSEATALIRVGSIDESYELYVNDTNYTPVIGMEGFFVEVQEIETSSPVLASEVTAPFSYGESATGLTWLDGKDIYEKTFTLSSATSPTAATWLSTVGTALIHNISNLGTVVYARGTISQSGIFYPFPYGISSSPSMAVSATAIESRNTSSTPWANSTVYITLQYTKN